MSDTEPKRLRRTASNTYIRESHRALELSSTSDGKKSMSELIEQETIHKLQISQQYADPFDSLYASGGVLYKTGGMQVIEPLYNPQILKRIPLENNILLQCIEAMALNIEATGYSLEYVGEKDDKTQESTASKLEYDRQKAFLDAPNEEYDLIELRKRIRIDRETFGCGYMEVIRDDSRRILAVYHLPANTMRITTPESEFVQVPYKVIRNGKEVKIVRNKRWRRFAQLQNINGTECVYFKEFGDERNVSSKTGKVSTDIPVEERATEVIMFSDYRSGHIYGYPRWINQLPAILGSRESEVVNLEFFKDNAIPALAVLVSGGYLSTDTIEAISKKFQRGRGRQKMNEVLIIEATGDEVAAKTDGQIPVPRLELKPMTADRQKDGLFQEYDDKCRDKIRCAFRLPPVLLGLTQDYTRATAEASIVVCESQVFGPERKHIDDIFNKYILGDGVNLPQYWRLKSNPTRIVDQADIANSIATLELSGALTPNCVISITNSMFGLDIKAIEEPWGDYPYSLVIELVKKGTPIQGLENLIDTLKQEADKQQAADITANANNQDPKQQDPKQKVTKAILNMTSKLQEALVPERTESA